MKERKERERHPLYLQSLLQSTRKQFTHIEHQHKPNNVICNACDVTDYSIKNITHPPQQLQIT